MGFLKAMLGFTVDSRFWAYLSETFINIAFFKKREEIVYFYLWFVLLCFYTGGE